MDDTKPEGTIMVTEDEFDMAVHAEMQSILTNKDYSESLGAAMIMAMTGATFARSVWKRLTGEMY